MKQPDTCKLCPGSKICTGFAADYVPPNPKIAVMLKMPGRDEIIEGTPMVGPAGRLWEQKILHKTGLKRGDILISNAIRCLPNSQSFPTGLNKFKMFHECRKYDGSLTSWDPTVIGITYNPAHLLRTPAEFVFLERATLQAKSLSDAGERPLLLCGDEAREIFASHLKGPLKKWAGHFERIKL